MLKNSLILILFSIIMISCMKTENYKYPEAKKVDHIDEYFGKKISDPYRWLEDTNSDDTKKWVSEEVNFTEEYLSNISFRKDIKKRLTKLWNYEKFYTLKKVGKFYYYYKNDGLQEHDILYKQKGLDGEGEIFLDPNTFSEDGSVSLSGVYFSNDGKYAGYAISRGGSDWNEFFVMSTETNRKLDDHLKWTKFSEMAWYKDGFYYSKYDEPNADEKLKASNVNQKLYYHKLGDDQKKDKLVLQDKDNPQYGFSSETTDDERFMFVSVWKGSSEEVMLYYKDFKNRTGIKPLIDEFKHEYIVVGNIGSKVYILTNDDAARKRIVTTNINGNRFTKFREIVPENKNTLLSATLAGGKLFLRYMKDAATLICVHDTDGKKLHDVKLPGVGSASGFNGKMSDKEVFYSYTSYTTPTTIYKYDIAKNKSELFKAPKLDYNVDDYETVVKFYKSKDGTRVPLFITHKKGLELNGNNPTLLYGYGGFNIPMTPDFRLGIFPLLENGGVYAVACLRGGSEYGEEWHKAGMLDNKQNVFDDFIAAGEFLVKEKYTNSDKMAMFGGSNGGLLVGAVMLQRPDLFKVAIPAVGVLDMLRYHKFTIGWAWAGEYGSSDDSLQFNNLIKYSPLHNVKTGVNYPATLITTADHDDRVFPAHSFKFAAELQNKYHGPNPALIRIETKTGHGAGTATSKTIEFYTDILSFMFYNIDEQPKY